MYYIVLFKITFFFFFSFFKCSVTCGGGVRSRIITCNLDPKKSCDMASKPRSRSLCGLQSCPNYSLRRRPGPPPKYRRLYPPKRQPTKPSEFTSTWFPTTIITSTAAPTVYSPTTRQTTLFHSTTLTQNTSVPDITDILHPEFNVVWTENKGNDLIPTKGSYPKRIKAAEGPENSRNEEKEEEEEGSTPNEKMYSPQYDYITEDRTIEEEIIDLDVTTTVKPSNAKPMVTIKTPLLTTYNTRVTTRSSQSRSTPRNNKYDRRSSLTTKAANTYSFFTSTTDSHTLTQLTTTVQPITTTGWPQATVKIIKPKKSTITPKATMETSPSKRKLQDPKENRSKKQNITSSDQNNLMARNIVVKDFSWVVGNWSEVS